jgi:hypothetical protein
MEIAGGLERHLDRARQGSEEGHQPAVILGAIRHPEPLVSPSGSSTRTAWNALPMSIATNDVPPESWSLVILSPSPVIKVENHGCW